MPVQYPALLRGSIAFSTFAPSSLHIFSYEVFQIKGINTLVVNAPAPGVTTNFGASSTIVMKNVSILSFGSGKLGDVVGYRTASGKMAARKRVYDPRNPRTRAQAVQRTAFAGLASVVRGFSTILSNSFDGQSNGSGDLNAFRRANSQLVRAAVIAGVNRDFDDYPATFVARGSYDIAAIANLQVSRGQLVNPQAIRSTDGALVLGLQSSYPDSTVFASAVEGLGYRLGDQVTIMSVYLTEDNETRAAYGRFVFRSDVSFNTETQVVVNGTLNPVMFSEVEGISASSSSENPSVVIYSSNSALVAACILSRFDGSKWIHSTEKFIGIGDFEGNNAAVIVPTFMDGASPAYSGGSDYYTEQAEEENPTTAAG